MKNSADQGGSYPQRPNIKICPRSLKEFRHYALCFSAHQI